MLGTRKTTVFVLALAVVLGLGSGAAGAAVVTATSAEAGTPGVDGLRGETGERGVTGASGQDGRDGVDGKDGKDGSAGAKGDAGEKGADGAAGPAGSAGAVGATGATGPAGPAGPAGATGATGATGPAGPAGANGLGSVPWADAVSGVQSVAGSGLVVFPGFSFNATYFQSTSDGIIVKQTGYYEISYAVRPVSGTVSTASLAASDNRSFVVHIDTRPLIPSRVYLPTVNVDMPSGPTLKVFVDGGTVEYSGVVQVYANSIITLHSEGTAPATDISASLIIKRLS